MKRTKLLMFLLFLSAGSLFAQKAVEGLITDNTGEPLIGANVMVKGTSTGTVTDFDGKFSLTVPDDQNVLVITYTGFQTLELNIGAGGYFEVVMQEGVTLSEAVVTALGITRSEKSLGYAVQEVSGDDLVRARETNIVNQLSGRVAGVQVMGSGNNLGGSSRVLMRGVGSVTGQNQPLFVVDGIPMDNSQFSTNVGLANVTGQVNNQARGVGGYDYGNAIQDINPDDIESISVLKGPAAAALYGSRAANGVILITTKRGDRARRGIGVSVNSGVTFERVAFLPDFQNEYGVILLPPNDAGEVFALYARDGSWGPRMEGQMYRAWDSFDDWDTENYLQSRPLVPTPNDIDKFFETGVAYNNNFALTGATDRSTFRFSFTNLNQTGVLPNSKLERTNLSLNATQNMTDNFRVMVGANYVKSSTLGRSGTGYNGENVFQGFNQWWQRQLDFERLKNYKNPDGSQRTWNRISATNPNPQYFDNPYWTRYENVQNDGRERFFGNASLQYDIADWISVTGSVKTDLYTDRRQERIAVGGVGVPMYREAVWQVQENNQELMFNISRELSDDLTLDAIVGGNMMQQTKELNQGTTQGGLNIAGFYSLANSAGAVNIIDYEEERRINSVFASASFGWRGMVYLDATLRNDWTSTLPQGNNSYMYPSVSSSFVFTELPALQNNRTFSYGKLRAGWAMVGNDAEPYSTGITYQPNQNFGSFPVYNVPLRLNNPDLLPEQTNSFEIGGDFRFLVNRIGIDITYYDMSTKNQIIPVDVSASSGYTSRFINAGLVTNKGIEAMLYLTPVSTPSFSWDLGLNFSRNWNEVVELAPEFGISILRFTSLFGAAVVAAEGEPYGMLEGYDYVYDDAGNKIVGDNGFYLRSPTTQPLASTMADYTGGLSNTFRFGNFTASVLFDFQKGGAVYSLTNQWGKYSGLLKETAENGIREDGIIVEGVKQDGTPNDVAIDAEAHFFLNGGFNISMADIYDASFIKLREVQLAYNFSRSQLDNLPFTSLSVALVGRNLAILYSGVPNIDPQQTTSASNVQGLEGGAFAPTRTVGVNLNFQF